MNDPDAVFILEGIREGFKITNKHNHSNYRQVESDNYHSAICDENIESVENQIKVELSEQRYIICENKPTIISALSAIKKSDGSVRLIHDCSRPSGEALNDYAELERKFKYQSVDDAVKLLQPGYFMAKADLKSAYRYVQIHPSQYELTGLKWAFGTSKSSTYMYDTRLPFGARLSPFIFHRCSQAVRRIMASMGFNVVVYLDDFLIVESTRERCKEGLDTLVKLLRELGFGISWKKVEDPCQKLIFLGICINSIDMSLSLPEDKLKELQTLLLSFSNRRRGSCRQLQSLAGKLNWACQVVNGGRSYLRRILDTIAHLRKPHHKARLSADFHADLQWWVNFLKIFNGKALMLSKAPICDVESDACNTGCGFTFNNDWGYIQWAMDCPELTTLHINYKETLAAIFAAFRWAPHWANQRVCFHVDNQTARAILNKGTCRNKTVMMYLRQLFWLSAIYNFKIQAIYLPGKLNVWADAVSRLTQKGCCMWVLSVVAQEAGVLPREAIPQLIYHLSMPTLGSLYSRLLAWHQ